MTNTCSKSIAIIIGADSYIAHALAVGLAFKNNGFRVDYFILSHDDKPLVNQRQIDRHTASNPIDFKSINEKVLYTDRYWRPYRFTFLGFPGTWFDRLLDWMGTVNWGAQNHRPKTITTFPGVLYFTQTWGQWTRHNADILLFNDRRTLRDYQMVSKFLFGHDAQNALLFGYPFKLCREASSEKIVYVDQNMLPDGHSARLKLAEDLVALATSRPSAKLTILARSKPTESSNHDAADGCHIAELIEKVSAQYGKNGKIEIEYGAPQAALASASLCLGITSTLMLEAIWAGIPTVPLKTPGIYGHLNGANIFQHTNFSMSFDELTHAKDVRRPSAKWINDNIHVISPQECIELIKRAQKPNRLAPKSLRYRVLKSLNNKLRKQIFKLVDLILHRRLNYN